MSAPSVSKATYAAIAVWLSVVGAGLKVLFDYASIPGPTGKPAQTWPAASILPQPHGRAQLVMIAHPHCPCTQASLTELAKITARTGDRLKPYVLIHCPSSGKHDWSKSKSWTRARTIAGVTVVADRDGSEARKFGALTSGHTFVYSGQGQLVFSGGITAARGHEGDNQGADLVLASVKTGAGTSPGTTPVFGCSVCERPR